jgi:hypothetical protein
MIPKQQALDIWMCGREHLFVIFTIMIVTGFSSDYGET